MATSKQPQILALKPRDEIIFVGPYEKTVTSHLELKNPTADQKVCFKVKTTAPRKYCVRPNCGVIEPGKSTRIAIILQPVDKISELAPAKHKFMVQSMIYTGQQENLDNDIWRRDQSKIMDSKLRCVFLDESLNPIGPSTSSSETASRAASGGGTFKEDDQAYQFLQRDRPPPVVGFSSKNTEISSSGAKCEVLSPEAEKSLLDRTSNSTSYQGAGDTSTFERFRTKGDQTLVYTALFMLIVGILLGKFLI